MEGTWWLSFGISQDEHGSGTAVPVVRGLALTGPEMTATFEVTAMVLLSKLLIATFAPLSILKNSKSTSLEAFPTPCQCPSFSASQPFGPGRGRHFAQL